MLNKIINRIESAKPNPVLFIGWVLLITTIRYSLEVVLISKFDTSQYIYHSLYYVTIFLFLPTFLIYLYTFEDIDRIINVVAVFIFPFKILSVIVDRLILGNMQNYAFLQGKPVFLLKYILLLQGFTPFLSKALAFEWLIISVLVGLYAAYKRKNLWLSPILVLVSYAIIVFVGAFVTTVIAPIVSDPLYDRLEQVFHIKLPRRYVILEVKTLTTIAYRFYASLFTATSFISFLIYSIIYLKERRGEFFRRLWWVMPVAFAGPFITRPFYVYDSIITSLALLSIFLCGAYMLYQKFLQGNEKTWAGIIFVGYSILLTIYTFRMDLYCIFGTLIGVGILVNFIAVAVDYTPKVSS